jgi:3-methyl-2-oxobutanoate hydroxymethyltransferase
MSLLTDDNQSALEYPMDPETNNPATRSKLSLSDLSAMKQRGEKIAMVTAYDAPSARLADAANIDIVLVGDSAGMTVLGYASTVPVTVDEMILLTRAVTRGARRPIIVADMPFGSFQVSDRTALKNAVRLVKEAGADAVKLERAGATLGRVRVLVDAGIPVMGHLGLTPQTATMLGGYKPQGRTASEARRLRTAALALEAAGCFAIVLEAVPAPVSAHITGILRIPTIGIGAGVACDGQVLVWHDLLGLTPGRVPRFVKQYADVGRVELKALIAYVADVRASKFPEQQHTYAMADEEAEQFQAELTASGSRKP